MRKVSILGGTIGRCMRKFEKEEIKEEKRTDRDIQVNATDIFKTTIITHRMERKQYEEQSKRK